MDCSPPGSSVSAISQTRILQRVAIPFSRGSSRQGIKPGSPAWQADSLPPEPPGKLQDVTAETQNRLHLIPRPDEGPWTSHPADPDLSFLFCKQERRVPPFKATREGEMRTDLCGRTRRLSFRSVQRVQLKVTVSGPRPASSCRPGFAITTDYLLSVTPHQCHGSTGNQQVPSASRTSALRITVDFRFQQRRAFPPGPSLC